MRESTFLEAYFREALSAITDHSINRIAELLMVGVPGTDRAAELVGTFSGVKSLCPVKPRSMRQKVSQIENCDWTRFTQNLGRRGFQNEYSFACEARVGQRSNREGLRS
jgi:hypothetical protein